MNEVNGVNAGQVNAITKTYHESDLGIVSVGTEVTGYESNLNIEDGDNKVGNEASENSLVVATTCNEDARNEEIPDVDANIYSIQRTELNANEDGGNDVNIESDAVEAISKVQTDMDKDGV